MYRIESRSDTIKEIQGYLIAVSDTENKIVPNGVFDAETKAEVEKFQSAKSLSSTGVVDYDTFQALYDEYKHTSLNDAVRRDTAGRIEFPVVQGDYGEGVAEVNTMMRKFLERYAGILCLRDSKYFSKESVKAAQRIREILLLGVSENVDEEMYQRMKNDEYSAFVFEQR